MQKQDCPMLCVQHRMNKRIMQLVTPIYGETYVAHASVENHLLCDLSQINSTVLTESSLLWIDTCGAEEGEQRDPITHSLYNSTEIDLCLTYVQQLQKLGVHDIAIITPYSAQVQKLKAKTNVDVYSVTAFQGQEREVIIASFIRANFDGNLGFVADAERLTVALTRARRLWIGIGDSSLLSIHPRFSEIFTEIEAQEAMLSIWDNPPF
jgi:superfamily I DNA and/or RNA helicase